MQKYWNVDTVILDGTLMFARRVLAAGSLLSLFRQMGCFGGEDIAIIDDRLKADATGAYLKQLAGKVTTESGQDRMVHCYCNYYEGGGGVG